MLFRQRMCLLSHVLLLYRVGWYNCNALNVCSITILFRYPLGYQIFWLSFLRYSAALTGKYYDSNCVSLGRFMFYMLYNA